MTRDVGERWHDEGTALSKKGAKRAEASFHNSIIGHFVVYKDRIERNLLQQCGHPENSEWFSVVSVIMFEVNIVAEQKQTYLQGLF